MVFPFALDNEQRPWHRRSGPTLVREPAAGPGDDV